MIVRELIELLKKEDENDLVILSSDEEGNSYTESYCIERAVYNINNGDVSIRNLTPLLMNKGYTEDDLCVGDRCINCIVIYP